MSQASHHARQGRGRPVTQTYGSGAEWKVRLRPNRIGWRTIVTIAFAGLLLSPLFGSADGFPLSTYPMYAAPRPAEATFIVARGVSVSADTVALSTSEIAGTRDPLIAEAYLRDAVAGGAERVERACASIASRASGQLVVQVEIRSQRHDLANRGSDVDTLVDDRLVTSCNVP